MPSNSTTELVKNLHKQVSAAAQLLESRWTYAALARVDAEVARRLREQHNLYVEACVTGTRREITVHGEALQRGYLVAVERLERACAPDDAYVIGVDLVTGLKVAIGQQKAALDRIRQVHGAGVIWVTPDEVARMLAGIESFKFVGAVKRLFPGAEILDRYPGESYSPESEEESAT